MNESMTESDRGAYRRALWCIRATGLLHIPFAVLALAGSVYMGLQITTRPDLPPLPGSETIPQVDPEAFALIQKIFFGIGGGLALLLFVFGWTIWRIAHGIEQEKRWAWTSGMVIGAFDLLAILGLSWQSLPFFIMGIVIVYGLLRPGVPGSR